MYHIDPNINVALERQADRVRAVQAIGHAPIPDHPVQAWPAEVPNSGPRPDRRLRWWRVAIGLGIVALAVIAWSGFVNYAWAAAR